MEFLLVALSDLTATEALAGRVAARAGAGDAILLEGPLGAGKTAFARAFLRVMDENPALEVPSPSFTLVQEYATARKKITHFDLWRLDGPGALAELGWEEARDGIVLVEWADRLGVLRPTDALVIQLSLGEGDARAARLSGWAGRLAGLA